MHIALHYYSKKKFSFLQFFASYSHRTTIPAVKCETTSSLLIDFHCSERISKDILKVAGKDPEDPLIVVDKGLRGSSLSC
jgi:hypothetical protein